MEQPIQRSNEENFSYSTEYTAFDEAEAFQAQQQELEDRLWGETFLEWLESNRLVTEPILSLSISVDVPLLFSL